MPAFRDDAETLRSRRLTLPQGTLTLDMLSEKLSLDATSISRIERGIIATVHPLVLVEWLKILSRAERAAQRKAKRKR